MDIDVARTVARAAFRSSRELSALVPVLKEKLAAEEYKTYSKVIATTIASIQLDIMNKLTAEHPGLETEIETAIRTAGHYA